MLALLRNLDQSCSRVTELSQLLNGSLDASCFHIILHLLEGNRNYCRQGRRRKGYRFRHSLCHGAVDPPLQHDARETPMFFFSLIISLLLLLRRWGRMREPRGEAKASIFLIFFFGVWKESGLYTNCPRFLRGNRLPP